MHRMDGRMVFQVGVFGSGRVGVDQPVPDTVT